LTVNSLKKSAIYWYVILVFTDKELYSDYMLHYEATDETDE